MCLPPAVDDVVARFPDRQRRIALDLFHHGVGPGLAHARKRQQALAEEPAIGRHVGDAGFDQIVEAAGDHVALQHFRRRLHGFREPLENVGCGLVEHHLDEHQQAQVQPVWIEPGAIALDKAVALQPLQPLADRGRRQPDPLGQFDIGNPSIPLKN